jgi:hypothetical protein
VLCSRVPLYQAMYSTIARRANARVGQACKSISSPLSEAKNDSETALSQHWPVRPQRQRDAAAGREGGELAGGVLAAPVAVEDHARVGSRAASALASAAETSSVRR